MHTMTTLLRFVTVMFLMAISCSGCREKQTAITVRADTAVSAVTTQLVKIPEGDKPPEPGAVSANHVPYGALVDYFFSANGKSAAFSVRNPGYSYVSFNGTPGKIYKFDVWMPVVLSADGKHVAYGAQVGDLWHMVYDGVEGAAFSQLRDPQFSPDGLHLAYTALKGEKWGIVVDRTWHPLESAQDVKFFFSGDSTLLAYIDQVQENYTGRLVIADLKLRKQKIVAPAGVHHMVCNNSKTMIAAVVSDAGKQRVVSFNFANPGEQKASSAYDAVNSVNFAPDGTTVAYTAHKAGADYMVLNDREELLVDSTLKEPPVVRPDLKGVAALIEDKQKKVYLQEFFVQDTKQKARYDGAEILTFSREGLPAFAAASAARKVWFLVIDGKEGPAYDRVATPRFSPDGKYVVYRARKDGKRFVVVADLKGKTIRQHPSYEQIFDVQFTADGKSVAYGVKDGQQLIWKVEPL